MKLSPLMYQSYFFTLVKITVLMFDKLGGI